MLKNYDEIVQRLKKSEEEYDVACKRSDNACLACGTYGLNHPEDKEKIEELRKAWYELDDISAQKYSALYWAKQDYLKYEYETQKPYTYNPVHKIQCSYCKQYFYSKSHRKLYCQYGCAKRIYFQRRKDKHYKKLEGRKCIKCDIVFKAKRMNMVYCSKACKQKAYRGRNK